MIGTPEYSVRTTLSSAGDLSIKVTAVCPFGSRSVTRTVDNITLDEKDEAKVKSIFAKVIANAVVDVVVPTGEKDDKGEIKLDEYGSPLKKTVQVPLSQQIFSDAAECVLIATKRGEDI
jgi:hypothetical protein